MIDNYLAQFNGWIRFPDRRIIGRFIFHNQDVTSLSWHPRGAITGENNLLITDYEEDEDTGIAKLTYDQILWRSKNKKYVEASSKPGIMYVTIQFDYKVQNPRLIMRRAIKGEFE